MTNNLKRSLSCCFSHRNTKCDSPFGLCFFKKTVLIKLMWLFCRKKEVLSSENMIFRRVPSTNLGAKLKKDNLGKTRSLQIWSVDPWPDDHPFIVHELFPDDVKALKDFIILFEKHLLSLKSKEKDHE